MVDTHLLSILLEIYLPRIHNHLAAFNSDLLPILTQWFLCLFVNTLPQEITLRIFDCFFYEGNKILLRATLAIFKLYEAEILKTNSFEELLELICKPTKIQNIDEFMELLFNRIWLRAFGRERLRIMREEIKTPILMAYENAQLELAKEKVKDQVLNPVNVKKSNHKSNHKSWNLVDPNSFSQFKNQNFDGMNNKVSNEKKKNALWVQTVGIKRSNVAAPSTSKKNKFFTFK